MTGTDRRISLTDARSAVGQFAASFGIGSSDGGLAAVVGESVDLSRGDHRRALHAWLNSWGCRIRYARPGEPDPFDDGVARWWARWRADLAAVNEPLSELSDEHISCLGAAFGDLSSSPAARTSAGTERTMGPTAAAKALYALRPATVMPWDLVIAERLHGGRDPAAFAAHLRLGRAWARQLLGDTGWDEPRLAAEVGQPGVALARLLDQYCYVRFTLDGRVPPTS